jgi:hypothetical protein
MAPGTLSQVLPSTELRALVRLGESGETLGVWARGCGRPRRLTTGSRQLALSQDLGFLLRRCERTVVRVSGTLHAMSAERLIAWRTLQIAVGSPVLPGLDAWRGLYPSLRVAEDRITVPLDRGSAEEVLALCAAERVAVLGSWIEYQMLTTHGDSG